MHLVICNMHCTTNPTLGCVKSSVPAISVESQADKAAITFGVEGLYASYHPKSSTDGVWLILCSVAASSTVQDSPVEHTNFLDFCTLVTGSHAGAGSDRLCRQRSAALQAQMHSSQPRHGRCAGGGSTSKAGHPQIRAGARFKA